MRVAILFMVLTVLSLMTAGVVTMASGSLESPDAPAGLTAEEQEGLDQVVEKVDAIEAVAEPGNEEENAEAAELEGLEPVEVPDSVDVGPENVWEKSPDGMPILDRLVKAVLRSRTLPFKKGEKKEFYWERGGVPVEANELIPLATQWAATFLYSLEEVKERTGVQLPVWGAIATMANEGGFWEGSLNYEARKWASEHSCKVLTTETWHGKTVRRKIETKLVDKFQQTYDQETVWRIIHDPHYKDAKVQVKGRDGKLKWVALANKADGGPWQMRFSVKKMSRERFDRLMSMQPGVYLGALEMANRAISYSRRYRAAEPHPRPWQLWPTLNPDTSRSLAYDAKITSIARWLGARKDEIERGHMVLDMSGKKPRYKRGIIR